MAALAETMKIARTEALEFATFHRRFDVVKEGEKSPVALTVRVCESLSYSMTGGEELLRKLPPILGKNVRRTRLGSTINHLKLRAFSQHAN